MFYCVNVEVVENPVRYYFSIIPNSSKILSTLAHVNLVKVGYRDSKSILPTFHLDYRLQENQVNKGL